MTSFLQLIETKRDGRRLTEAQIQGLINDFVAGQIPDYQMAAFLMAVYFQGLTPMETRALTLAMRDSGEVLRFPDDSRPLVDKHSTGGVGDKVSLPLAPLLACLGFRVPMISGRGLGITGGTLDKLESIPGFSTQLTPTQIVHQVQEIGVAMAGQTETMIPADKLIYALRDVTGTVPSIPLITASILSKKLAEGLDALIMDVKFGSAAFMDTLEQARTLGKAISTLAEECSVKTRVLLTDMSTPLGRAAGNWLEIRESVACLQGQGPADLQMLVVECAARLLAQTEHTGHVEAGRRLAKQCLDSGEPLKKWEQMLMAQGSDLSAYQRKLAAGNMAPCVVELRSPQAGMIKSLNARTVGELVRDLGGGRITKDSALNYEVGVDCLIKPGESVQAGSLMGRVHLAEPAQAEAALARLASAFDITTETVILPPLIPEVI